MTSNHPSETGPSTEHAQRASRAADSILSRYTRRVFGVPGTLLGAVQMPESRGLVARFAEWHYWWQAHLLDCIIDAGERAVREGDTEQAQNMLATARSVVRGIHTRNLGFANDFYDDMAWLALAVGGSIGSVKQSPAPRTLRRRMPDRYSLKGLTPAFIPAAA